MSLLIDLQFVGRISGLVRNFKKKKDYLWSYSCPACGDSQRYKLKARGYIFRNTSGDRLVFKCHNCGLSGSFSSLLKMLDYSLFKDYLCETFLDQKGSRPFSDHKPVPPVKQSEKSRPDTETALLGCFPIAALEATHPARAYLESRNLPVESLAKLYWTDKFSSVADQVSPDHGYNLTAEGRIVIPFLDHSGKLLAVQGRTLDPLNSLRYITIKAFDTAPRIFGLDRLSDSPKTVYVVEGAFDSLFVPDCIALAGSDIPESLPTGRAVIVFDNERRKPETCKKIAMAIKRGYRVCIWPESVREKDINLMVMAGYTPEAIKTIIDQNTYSGLVASMRLASWRKA